MARGEETCVIWGLTPNDTLRAAGGEEGAGVALEHLVLDGREANDARMLGQGELEAIGAAEALGAQGVDERVRIESEREFLDAEVLEVIVLREHLIDREVAHIDRETGLKAHALRIEAIRLHPPGRRKARAPWSGRT